eukprot:1122970-Prorocentrum_lima.AAC.1
MIKIFKSGKSTRLGYLTRTYRVSCAFLAECFEKQECLDVRVTKTMDQAAGIHTERLSDPREWLHALTLNNLITPPHFWGSTTRQSYHE